MIFSTSIFFLKEIHPDLNQPNLTLQFRIRCYGGTFGSGPFVTEEPKPEPPQNRPAPQPWWGPSKKWILTQCARLIDYAANIYMREAHTRRWAGGVHTRTYQQSCMFLKATAR